jgi:NAD-dependent SIR2 family protein deacetylase
MQSDYDHGESLECLACGAVYAATAVENCILTEDDARCTSCTNVMTHWPQKVRFEMIETASEAQG